MADERHFIFFDKQNRPVGMGTEVTVEVKRGRAVEEQTIMAGHGTETKRREPVSKETLDQVRQGKIKLQNLRPTY